MWKFVKKGDREARERNDYNASRCSLLQIRVIGIQTLLLLVPPCLTLLHSELSVPQLDSLVVVGE
jgi:hypothetical protein